MKARGMHIDDVEDLISLSDILSEINNGEEFFWSIFDFWVILKKESSPETIAIIKQINDQKGGYIIDWNNLKKIANELLQFIDGTLLASKDKDKIITYKTDQDMYETCDIFIHLYDGGCWEIFTQDEELFTRLARRFKVDKFLETDFQKYL